MEWFYKSIKLFIYLFLFQGFHRGYFIEFVPMMDYTIEELYG